MENKISRTVLEKFVIILSLFTGVGGLYIIVNMFQILFSSLSEINELDIALIIPFGIKILIAFLCLAIIVLVFLLSLTYCKKVISSYKHQNYKNIIFKVFYILLIGFLSIVTDLITVYYSDATFLFVGIINIFLMIVLKNRCISKNNI